MQVAKKRFRYPKSDLTGQRFGKLVATEWRGNSRWLCRCDCGGEAEILTANLKRGNSSSCGCIRNIKSSKRATTHGLSNTLAYKAWLGIRRRCRDVNHTSYGAYGARGIDVYQPWYESAAAFVDYVGQPPTPEHTLDRIDNAKGYEPGNVRWATPTEQARNRSVCVAVEFQGMTFPAVSAFVEWLAPQTNIKRGTLERALSKL